MDLIHTVAQLRARLKRESSVAFVPTMGNLHAGHLALVEAAHRHGKCVAASIFVNRLQFEPGTDFERYPRTLAQDRVKLERAKSSVKVMSKKERDAFERSKAYKAIDAQVQANVDKLVGAPPRQVVRGKKGHGKGKWGVNPFTGKRVWVPAQ